MWLDETPRFFLSVIFALLVRAFVVELGAAGVLKRLYHMMIRFLFAVPFFFVLTSQLHSSFYSFPGITRKQNGAEHDYYYHSNEGSRCTCWQKCDISLSDCESCLLPWTPPLLPPLPPRQTFPSLFSLCHVTNLLSCDKLCAQFLFFLNSFCCFFAAT